MYRQARKGAASLLSGITLAVVGAVYGTVSEASTPQQKKEKKKPLEVQFAGTLRGQRMEDGGWRGSEEAGRWW